MTTRLSRFQLPSSPLAIAGSLVSVVCAVLLTGCDGAERARRAERAMAEPAHFSVAPHTQSAIVNTSSAADRRSRASDAGARAHCAPPTNGAPWVETGRITDQNRSYVMLAHRGEPTNLEGALVLLAEGGCQADLLGQDASAAAGSGMPRPDDTAYAQLVDQDFQWRVDQSGSVERLANALLEGDADHIEECAPGDYAGCVPTWLAERLRSRGIRVSPPSS